MTLLEILFLATVLLGVINSLVFAVGYHLKSHGSWVKHIMGQNLMGLPVIIGLILSMLFVSRLVGGLGLVAWIIALLVLNAVMAQRNYLLFSTKWRSRVGDAGEDTIREQRR